MQPEFSLLIISQPAKLTDGVNQPALEPLSIRRCSQAQKTLGVCASVIRLCFVSVPQVGREEEEQKRSWRWLAVAEHPPRPSSKRPLQGRKSPRTYPLGWPEGLSASPGPGGRGAPAPHVPQKAQMWRPVAGKPSTPPGGTGSPISSSRGRRGSPPPAPAPHPPRPRRQGG